jgi:hypothetical protein
MVQASRLQMKGDTRMCVRFRSLLARQLAVLSVTLAAQTFSRDTMAVEPPSPHGVRSGGVLQEAFQHHRQPPYAPLSKVPRYSYGFPVPTYNWGWFGAKHYYPRTISHRGYYGDYWQWSYRRGD